MIIFLLNPSHRISKQMCSITTRMLKLLGGSLNFRIFVLDLEVRNADYTLKFSVFSAREMLKMHRNVSIYLYQINGQISFSLAWSEWKIKSIYHKNRSCTFIVTWIKWFWIRRSHTLTFQKKQHIKRAISRVVVSRKQALSIIVEGLLFYIVDISNFNSIFLNSLLSSWKHIWDE